MSEEAEDYASYFHAGGRVRVEVPLAGGGAFHEWGVVRSLERDLLELDLSRDSLPQQASLELGRILELGLLDDEARRCRAMVASDPDQHRLVLRLVGCVAEFEPREFFRQDVYLPLDYRLPSGQVADQIRTRWQQRRWDLELAAQEPEPGEPAELEALRKRVRARLELRKAATPVAANISGGGVRFAVPERLWPGMLVELSIYLPQPQRVLEIVGEVVQVNPLVDGIHFSTALRYRFIDEADRDRLIGHVSAQQLLQLSHQGPRLSDAVVPTGAGRSRRYLLFALCLAILLALIGYQLREIAAKRERGEMHEIERLFQEGITEYLRQRQ